MTSRRSAPPSPTPTAVRREERPQSFGSPRQPPPLVGCSLHRSPARLTPRCTTRQHRPGRRSRSSPDRERTVDCGYLETRTRRNGRSPRGGSLRNNPVVPRPQLTLTIGGLVFHLDLEQELHRIRK